MVGGQGDILLAREAESVEGEMDLSILKDIVRMKIK